MDLVRQIENCSAKAMQVRAMGITPKEVKKLKISKTLHQLRHAANNTNQR